MTPKGSSRRIGREVEAHPDLFRRLCRHELSRFAVSTLRRESSDLSGDEFALVFKWAFGRASRGRPNRQFEKALQDLPDLLAATHAFNCALLVLDAWGASERGEHHAPPTLGDLAFEQLQKKHPDVEPEGVDVLAEMLQPHSRNVVEARRRATDLWSRFEERVAPHVDQFAETDKSTIPSKFYRDFGRSPRKRSLPPALKAQIEAIRSHAALRSRAQK